MNKYIDISKFKELEKLETAALEEIIRADFQATAEYDEEMIEYVLVILSQRKQLEGEDELPDVNTAWEHFRAKLDENNGLAESLDIQPKKKHATKRSVRSLLQKLVVAAACFSVCFSCLLTVQADIKNSSNLYALWGNGTFRFVSEEEYLANYEEDHEPPVHTFSENMNKDDYSEIDPRLEELFVKAEEVGLPTELLPRWFPENCHLVETGNDRMKPFTSADVTFEWDEEAIFILSFSLMKYDYPVCRGFPSTLKGIYPELYTSGQFTFFVYCYYGVWFAVWDSFPYQITIFGIDTKENMFKIIDSIEGGTYE